MYICSCYCDDITLTENIIKNTFKNIYEQKLNLGTEYFEGDVHNMTSALLTLTQSNFKNNVFAIIQKRKIEAALIIQNNYNKYQERKKRIKLEIQYDDAIKQFIENKICDSEDEFLELKDLLKLWNENYSSFIMNYHGMIIKSIPCLGKIIIRDGMMGWPNKKIGNKKFEYECNKIIESFIDDNILISKDDFMVFNDVKNLFKVRYPKILLNDNSLQKKLQKSIGPLKIKKSKLGWQGKSLEENTRMKKSKLDQGQEKRQEESNFESQSLIETNDASLSNSNQSVYDIFLRCYQPCNDRKHYIKLKDVAKCIDEQSNGKFYDKLEIKKELKQYGLNFDMKPTTLKGDKFRGRLFGYTIKEDQSQ